MITNIVFIIKGDMKILEFLWKLGRRYGYTTGEIKL